MNQHSFSKFYTNSRSLRSKSHLTDEFFEINKLYLLFYSCHVIFCQKKLNVLFLGYLFISATLDISSSSSAYSFGILSTILAKRTLLTTALNISVVVFENHLLRFLNHGILLLPGPLFPNTFPWIMNFKILYLVPFLFICPRYSSFRLLIMFITYSSFLIVY